MRRHPTSSKAVPQERLLPIVLGYWPARALAVATELDGPDLLAQGPLHVEALASRTNTDGSAVFRLLRALESIGIFVQVSPRIFSNTAASECLRKDVPGSQWPTVVHCLPKAVRMLFSISWSFLVHFSTIDTCFSTTLLLSLFDTVFAWIAFFDRQPRNNPIATCVPSATIFPSNAQVVANPALATYGTLPRNFLRGPGYINIDMAFSKTTAITERVKVEFRAEFFNLFNHVNLLNLCVNNNNDGMFSGAATGNNPNSSQFGQITSTYDPRIVQLALRLAF